jgi:hypothetical protein
MRFSGELIQSVWETARATEGRDPTRWRKDQCGAWLQREHYGNRRSEYGWKLEKVSPDAADSSESFQAFHWENGFDVENGRPRCRITADREDALPGQRVEPPRNTER